MNPILNPDNKQDNGMGPSTNALRSTQTDEPQIILYTPDPLGINNQPSTVTNTPTSESFRTTETSQTKVTYPASTQSSASINIPQGFDPLQPQEGDIWNSNSKRGLVIYNNGISQALSASGYKTLIGNVVNGTGEQFVSEQPLGATLEGFKALSLNSGRVLRYKGFGYIDTSASAINLRVRMYINNVVIADTGTKALDTSVSSNLWEIDTQFRILVSSGINILGQGYWQYIDNTTRWKPFQMINSGYTVVSPDASGWYYTQLSFELSGAGAGGTNIQITNLISEIF